MNDISDASLAVSVSLKRHYAERIFPIWRGPGFNQELGLAFEAVSSDTCQPLPTSRYRAMACARQLFVFSLAGQLDHAAVLFASLQRYFLDRQYGGWYFSVDAAGKPKECQKDLYTHAFIVFAAAEYARASGSVEALDVMNRTAALIEERFRVGEQASGLMNAVTSENFSAAIEGPLQNPMMHLAEAWLAARSASGGAVYDARLASLAQAIASNFVHAPTGCIAELPVGRPGNRLEPGHQFEWYFLIFGSQHPAFEAAGLCASLSSAFEFARRHGVDLETGGVCAAVDEQGTIIDATQRIWAQTEYLRALATHADGAVRSLLDGEANRFRSRFLHERGWYECLAPDGSVTRADMPSTTPYHLATAFSVLP